MADLKELGAGKRDFCIVRTMDDKKMAAVGGVMSSFPGGYSHAAVYARGAGMAALSSPTVGAAWEKFVDRLTGDKMYYDDSGGQIVMMPLSVAIAEGRVTAGDVPRLAPGANREVTYLGWDEAVKAWTEIGKHAVRVHPDRPTHHVSIYTPAKSVEGLGEKCVSFDEAGPLGVNGRGLGGEKNTLLSMMAVDPELSAFIPPGSYIPTTRCFQILDDAGVLRAWRDVYDRDPEVGQIDDRNFLESRFYTDAAYRNAVREEMRTLVTARVHALFFGAAGEVSAKGKELLDELRANGKLAGFDNWIMRSSYSAEDRPYKSGAGQYDSVPNCLTDAERLEAVIIVLTAAWHEKPIENNVIEEYNLMHIAPSITAMRCLDAQYSGVALSRDTDTGYRRTVSFQAVEGFGGGVEHGVTEEGRIDEGGSRAVRLLPGRDTSLLPPEIQRQLWDVMMKIERLFHQKVEPGKGYAVDVEWVFDKTDQKLYVVQARTVRV
jgi:hypothetical protein